VTPPSPRYDRRRAPAAIAAGGGAVAFDDTDGTVIVVGDMDIYKVERTRFAD
jgi:hypothetical protein